MTAAAARFPRAGARGRQQLFKKAQTRTDGRSHHVCLSTSIATREHRLRNQMAIVLGYGALPLRDPEAGARFRGDVTEMHKAATAAMVILRSADDNLLVPQPQETP